MKNSKIIIGSLAVLCVISGFIVWKNTFAQTTDTSKGAITPTPTQTVALLRTPSVTAVPVEVPVMEYTSSKAHLHLKFKELMYVLDTTQTSNSGFISVSKNPIWPRKASSGIEISYESPTISEKGGACSVAWKKVTVLDQVLDVCETTSSFSGGYLSNKTNKTEYYFWIDDSNKDAKKFLAGEYEMYKEIVLNGLSFK